MGRRSGEAWCSSSAEPRDGFQLLAVGRRSKPSWIRGSTRPLLPLFPSSPFPGACLTVPSSRCPARSQLVHEWEGLRGQGVHHRPPSLESPPSPPFSIRAHACIAGVPPPSPASLWINLPKVNGRKEGGETEMMMTDFFLLLEPGEGGCFASWTSAKNSLPDNHLGTFTAF